MEQDAIYLNPTNVPKFIDHPKWPKQRFANARDEQCWVKMNSSSQNCRSFPNKIEFLRKHVELRTLQKIVESTISEETAWLLLCLLGTVYKH